MITRVIVCGSRGFNDREKCFKYLDKLLSDVESFEIVSGHAAGADLLGEEYANAKGAKLTVFKPDWNKYGRAAGPVRNQQMLDYALLGRAIVIVFWDDKSRGSKDMFDRARKAGAEVHIIHYIGDGDDALE